MGNYKYDRELITVTGLHKLVKKRLKKERREYKIENSVLRQAIAENSGVADVLMRQPELAKVFSNFMSPKAKRETLSRYVQNIPNDVEHILTVAADYTPLFHHNTTWDDVKHDVAAGHSRAPETKKLYEKTVEALREGETLKDIRKVYRDRADILPHIIPGIPNSDFVTDEGREVHGIEIERALEESGVPRDELETMRDIVALERFVGGIPEELEDRDVSEVSGDRSLPWDKDGHVVRGSFPIADLPSDADFDDEIPIADLPSDDDFDGDDTPTETTITRTPKTPKGGALAAETFNLHRPGVKLRILESYIRDGVKPRDINKYEVSHWGSKQLKTLQMM